MHSIRYFLPFLGLLTSAYALTIDDIANKTALHPARPSGAYRVSIVSVVSMGRQTIKDSGTLEFSPPDCFHIILSNGKIDQSGCGDTSWTATPDGSVTRKIGSGFNTQFKTPDIAEMLKKQNARVVSDTGKMAVVEIEVPGDKNTIKAQFSIDTTEWLVRKSLVIPETGMPVESGYAYDTFMGKPVISQISTVMGAGGFVKISFLNYTRIKKIPRSKFKKL
jgi:hypothetical protein